MITLEIPKQEVQAKHVPKKNGPGEWVFTEFTATHDGQHIRCQVWDDVTPIIAAAMGGELTVQSIEPGKWGTYKVKLAGATTPVTTATTTPGPAVTTVASGYCGRALSIDEWVNQSKHVVVQCPAECDVAPWLESYWECVARNVVLL